MSPIHVYVHFRPYRRHTAAGVARFYYWIFIGWWLWLTILAVYVLAAAVVLTARAGNAAWQHYRQRRVFVGHGPRDWTPR